MIAEYGLTEQDAATLTATRAFADQFEAGGEARRRARRRVANLVQSELTSRLRPPELNSSSRRISLAGIVLAADLAEGGELSASSSSSFSTPASEASDFAVVYEREKPQQISDCLRDRER